MSTVEPRRRGRPPGSKNKKSQTPQEAEQAGLNLRPDPQPLAAYQRMEWPAPTDSSTSAGGTSRASLEADRARLLEGIKACQRDAKCEHCGADGSDWKTIAALQSQLNGVNRMLLRITGETAPTDANLIRSPQWLRLRADLIGVLKKHPAALADVASFFDTAEQ